MIFSHGGCEFFSKKCLNHLCVKETVGVYKYDLKDQTGELSPSSKRLGLRDGRTQVGVLDGHGSSPSISYSPFKTMRSVSS